MKTIQEQNFISNNKRIMLQIVGKIQLEIQFSNEIEKYWVWTERDKYNNIRHYITNTTVEYKKEISPQAIILEGIELT